MLSTAMNASGGVPKRRPVAASIESQDGSGDPSAKPAAWVTGPSMPAYRLELHRQLRYANFECPRVRRPNRRHVDWIAVVVAIIGQHVGERYGEHAVLDNRVAVVGDIRQLAPRLDVDDDDRRLMGHSALHVHRLVGNGNRTVEIFRCRDANVLVVDQMNAYAAAVDLHQIVDNKVPDQRECRRAPVGRFANADAHRNRADYRLCGGVPLSVSVSGIEVEPIRQREARRLWSCLSLQAAARGRPAAQKCRARQAPGQKRRSRGSSGSVRIDDELDSEAPAKSADIQA